ncbi:MAG TPA: 23S rRNA (pseudouridine(1915)-N(3))-methyltransferase RlmH [Verrucomicrobiae bacterium]|jgi:23S rRNA (pseudouridine1915-N3)-methyltransferase|nr:23S rRNA (pseudouridine(1915)-N(3))-methyltransferase RlmH [Verrucomicrobiae bacterium]
MAIKIIAVGKKHETWVAEGIRRYETRLQRPFNVEWVLLPHSARDGLQAREDESERLLLRLDKDDFIVLLDERGKLFDSPGLSRMLLEPLERSRSVVVLVGGAYGVDASVHERADVVWSLSPLVFPHQLVRLILAEQLYRAQEIAAGRPYHHS